MDELHSPAPAPHPTGRRLGYLAAGVAAGVVLAGLGVSAAQTSTPTAPPSNGVERAPEAAPPGSERKVGPGGRGHKGLGRGMGMGIHGEFTTKAPGGGYQTVATQHGDVTAVSATSITVKSEDGFSRTYSVDDNTLVNAGNDGIADVKSGDKVHVVAIVTGGNARAVQVMDVTKVRELRGKWKPARPGPSASARPSA